MSSPALLRRALTQHPPTLRRYRSLSTPSSSPEIYDIVCIGGGPAGLAFLSALRAHPSTRHLKIALLDSQALRPHPLAETDSSHTFSNRCSSLTPSSVRFLRQIQAWKEVREARTQGYHGMQVWDGVSGSRIHFDPWDRKGSGLVDAVSRLIPGHRTVARGVTDEVDWRDDEMARMCENVNLTTALLKSLDGTRSGLEIMDETKVESIHFGPEATDGESLNLAFWPTVRTSRGEMAARLLIGADGANSPVRTFAGISSHGWDYEQHGVVATLTLNHSFGHDELRTAYQRFLPTGTVALLPLPDNKASLVWSTTPSLAARLKQLSTDDFVAMVNAAFRLLPVDINYLLTQQTSGQVEDVTWRESNTSPKETGLPAHFPRITAVQQGSIASFPLKMRHASTYTGHRVALIGDAAHSVHPLAGQGLNLGLADAEALAARVVYGIEHGMDIGSCWCLDEYNKDRWAANNAMLGVVDKLQKLYSVGSGPVVWGRSLGLDLVNRLTPVKSMLMGAAA